MWKLCRCSMAQNHNNHMHLVFQWTATLNTYHRSEWYVCLFPFLPSLFPHPLHVPLSLFHTVLSPSQTRKHTHRNLPQHILALFGGERRQSLQESVHMWNVKYWNCTIIKTQWSPTLVFFDVVDITFVVHQVFVVLLIQGWVRLQLGLKPWTCNRLLLISPLFLSIVCL